MCKAMNRSISNVLFAAFGKVTETNAVVNPLPVRGASSLAQRLPPIVGAMAQIQTERCARKVGRATARNGEILATVG